MDKALNIVLLYRSAGPFALGVAVALKLIFMFMPWQ
jgi:hypothetical protein